MLLQINGVVEIELMGESFIQQVLNPSYVLRNEAKW